MREMPHDLYALIGVAPGATEEEIRRAYEALARYLSPDNNPGAPDLERFRLVSEAYRVLTSSELRAEYDAQRRLAAEQRMSSRPTGRSATPTGAPVHGSWMAADAAPLDLTLTLGAPLIAPLEEPERFYLLAELGPTGALAEPPPVRLNLALMTPRSLSLRDPNLMETRRALAALTTLLRPDDRLTLVTFDDQADVLLDGESVAGRAGIEALLDGRPPRGAAQLSDALDLTLERLAARIEPSSVSALALIMDDTAGDDEGLMLELAEQAQQLGVAVVALGIGMDWDRDVLDQMTSVSGGTCAFVDDLRYLTPALADLVERLHATIASRVRLTLAPSPGVSILRAAQIAPGLASVFEGPHTPGAPVTVALGALAGGPDARGSAALWELLLEPSALTVAADGQVDLGVIESTYWTPWQQGGRMARARRPALAPRVSGVGQPAFAPDVRLALELLTAYRLQERADHLISMGDVEEACAALDVSEARLASAGATHLAEDARQVLMAVSAGMEQAPVMALHALYSLRNHSPFHHLRQSRGGPPGA